MGLFLLFEGMFTIPLLILMGFSLVATTPVILAMLQELDSDRPAFINSIFMSISFLLGALDTMIVGLMGDTFGLENTYRVSAILAVGAVPFILKLKGFRGKR
jgi:FSR family fosmidomycin resistance protein-like MFS transporter